MGWASGSYLAEEIYDKFREYIPEDKREELATWLYNRFCNEDADDWDNSNLIKDAKIFK
jgi:hypothetical protein